MKFKIEKDDHSLGYEVSVLTPFYGWNMIAEVRTYRMAQAVVRVAKKNPKLVEK